MTASPRVLKVRARIAKRPEEKRQTAMDAEFRRQYTLRKIREIRAMFWGETKK